MDRIHAGSSKGKPKHTALLATTQLRPIQIAYIKILYFKHFTALSDSNTTNDMLTIILMLISMEH